MSPLDPAAFVRDAYGADVRWTLLPGDASDRRYFRVHLDGGSRVVMLLAEPFSSPYQPFERMTRFLEEHGLPVPRLLERHPEEQALVLEDLGDVSLQAHLGGPAGSDADERRALYEQAVDLIVRLQRVGTPAITPDVPAYHFALDGVKLARELDYFARHYVRGLRGAALSEAQSERLARSLQALAARAGRSGDRVLCHRDFHSRNLMLPPGRPAEARLVMIDHQDARLGPRAYDLASLLCDPYVQVPAGLAGAMTARFLRGVGRQDHAGEFAADYAAVAAQRTLKAVGTFAGQAQLFGVDRYVEYIPPALEAARAALRRLGDGDDLLDLLDGPLAWR